VSVTSPRRRFAASAPAVFATVLLLALLASTWRFPLSSDGSAMLATAESLWSSGSLAIDSRFTFDDGYSPSARLGRDGRPYAKYGLGLPLVQVPVLAAADTLARVLSLPRERARPVLLSLLNPVLTALLGIVILALGRELGATPGAAAATALLSIVTTFAWVYAVTDGTEALQALVVGAAGWMLHRFTRSRRRRHAALCGAALAWGVLTKSTLAVLVPAFALGIGMAAWSSTTGTQGPLRERVPGRRARAAAWRRAVASVVFFAAPVGVVLVLIAWLNSWRFGSPFETGYNAPVLTNPVVSGLYGLLLSPNKGLVFYAPMTLLALPAGAWLWRRDRACALAFALAAASWALLNARFYDWGGGWSWGPRYLQPILPLLLAPIAPLLGTPGWRKAAIPLALAGVLVTLLGVTISEDAYRRTTMRLWMAEETGYVLAGSSTRPGDLVSIPVAAEDVLPPFSSIAGHWWLARVAAAGCDCSDATVACGCRDGRSFEEGPFARYPWRQRYPEAIPAPPWGASLIEPALLRRLYRAWVFDPDGQAGSGQLTD
jgi:hypothetical protein